MMQWDWEIFLKKERKENQVVPKQNVKRIYLPHLIYSHDINTGVINNVPLQFKGIVFLVVFT